MIDGSARSVRSALFIRNMAALKGTRNSWHRRKEVKRRLSQKY
jgi:hypothetical protein